MTSTRREFIQSMGIAAASLVLLRCSALSSQDSSPSGRLRGAWLQLDWLALQSKDDWERGEKARQELAAQHRAALDELVDAGELSSEVADEVQAAFDAAAYHIYRSNAPITCYEPMIVDYAPVSSDQLTQQAELLTQMAEKGELDPATVSKARAALERDIAFLSLSPEERQALYDQLIQAANQGAVVPAFDQLELEITPQAAEAARFLLELLLKE